MVWDRSKNHPACAEWVRGYFLKMVKTIGSEDKKFFGMPAEGFQNQFSHEFRWEGLIKPKNSFKLQIYFREN